MNWLVACALDLIIVWLGV